MSVDLAFWKSGHGAPEELYELAAEGDIERFEGHSSVLDFRTELLVRWPDLSDYVEPLEYDPDLDVQEDLSRYVLLTLSVSMSDMIPDIVELALSHGLRGYDPQHQSAFA